MVPQTHAPIKDTLIRTLKRGDKLTTIQISLRTGLPRKRAQDTLRLWTCFNKTQDKPPKWYYNNQNPEEHSRNKQGQPTCRNTNCDNRAMAEGLCTSCYESK